MKIKSSMSQVSNYGSPDPHRKLKLPVIPHKNSYVRYIPQKSQISYDFVPRSYRRITQQPGSNYIHSISVLSHNSQKSSKRRTPSKPEAAISESTSKRSYSGIPSISYLKEGFFHRQSKRGLTRKSPTIRHSRYQTPQPVADEHSELKKEENSSLMDNVIAQAIEEYALNELSETEDEHRVNQFDKYFGKNGEEEVQMLEKLISMFCDH